MNNENPPNNIQVQTIPPLVVTRKKKSKKSKKGGSRAGSPPSGQRGKGRSAPRAGRHDWAETEIVKRLYKPIIDGLLAKGVAGIADLTEKFRTATSSGVSVEGMKGWLTILGYTFTRPQVQITVTRPQAPVRVVEVPEFSQPALEPAAELEDPTDLGVRFENENTVPDGAVIPPALLNTARGRQAMEQQVGFAPDFRPRQ